MRLGTTGEIRIRLLFDAGDGRMAPGRLVEEGIGESAASTNLMAQGLDKGGMIEGRWVRRSRFRWPQVAAQSRRPALVARRPRVPSGSLGGARERQKLHWKT